jgi:archaemetzincin
MKIILIPFEEIDSRVAPHLKTVLADVFGVAVESSDKISIPRAAFDRTRNQYESTPFMALLQRVEKLPDDKVLGITDVDLFAQGLNFIFGQADVTLGIAVISLARLKEGDKFLERTAKEAIHELGHTLKIEHCENIECVMHFSNSLHDTDIKGVVFCSKCQPKLFR